MGKLRVLIVDDHGIVREAIRNLLESQDGVKVVGEAADGNEAVSKVERTKPDVVLMDLTMPGMGGIEATAQIKSSHPDVKVLALTMHDSDDHFSQMMSAGASGYFIKGGSSAELVSALRTVSTGNVYLHPSVAERLVRNHVTGSGANRERETTVGISMREREVLRRIAEGRSNREVAELLSISPATVQTHRAHIIAKLGLRNHTELVKYALLHGLISHESPIGPP